MAVYIDNARIPYGRMIMCHMVADTLDELHAMAERLGLRRKWFQDKGSVPHYDVGLSKKKIAIEFGAEEVGRHRFIEIVRRNRKEQS
jgi:hypothetical protein